MRVSYEEGVAYHFGLQRRYDGGNAVVRSAGAEGNAGQLSSSEIIPFVCRPCPDLGKAIPGVPHWQGATGHGGVIQPGDVWKFQTREPESPLGSFTGPPASGRTVSEPLRGHGWHER